MKKLEKKMSTTEKLEKRIEKLEKLGKLFEFLLNIVEGIQQSIVSYKENIQGDKIMMSTLKKIRNKYNEITLK